VTRGPPSPSTATTTKCLDHSPDATESSTIFCTSSGGLPSSHAWATHRSSRPFANSWSTGSCPIGSIGSGWRYSVVGLGLWGRSGVVVVKSGVEGRGAGIAANTAPAAKPTNCSPSPVGSSPLSCASAGQAPSYLPTTSSGCPQNTSGRIGGNSSIWVTPCGLVVRACDWMDFFVRVIGGKEKEEPTWKPRGSRAGRAPARSARTCTISRTSLSSGAAAATIICSICGRTCCGRNAESLMPLPIVASCFRKKWLQYGPIPKVNTLGLIGGRPPPGTPLPAAGGCGGGCPWLPVALVPPPPLPV